LSATSDTTGPSISINNISNAFDGDQNNWCNYTKYTAGNYGSTLNPELAGCKYYKDKISHSNALSINPDLLENMEVVVDDVSGISEVTIELGGCTATYSITTAIRQVVAAINGAYGADNLFRQLTFKYNSLSTSTASPPTVVGGTTSGDATTGGVGMPSLLTLF
jgi:hypothetical protein